MKSVLGAVSLVAILATSLSGCRYQTIWSGAEQEPNGKTIRLVADEPLCGCLKLRNFSDRDILLRSLLQGEELGQQVLPKQSTADIRFDWAGPEGSDIYHLEGWDATGKRVPLSQVAVIDDNGWPWRVCNQAACQYGTLLMNAGEQRR